MRNDPRECRTWNDKYRNPWKKRQKPSPGGETCKRKSTEARGKAQRARSYSASEAGERPTKGSVDKSGQTEENSDMRSLRNVSWGIKRPSNFRNNLRGTLGEDKTYAVSAPKSAKESGGSVTKPAAPSTQYPRIRPCEARTTAFSGDHNTPTEFAEARQAEAHGAESRESKRE